MPAVNITESWLKRIAPDEATGKAPAIDGKDRARFFDASLPGFGVLIGKRFATFIARARVGGVRRDVTIGHWGRAGAGENHAERWTEARARKEAMRLLGSMSSGKDPVTVKTSADSVTLRYGLELHISQMRAGQNRRQKPCSPTSIRKFEKEVPYHLGDWLDRPIVELTSEELQKVCERIEANTVAMAGAVNKPGVAQANKIIAHVSAIWNALHKRDPKLPNGLPGSNPAMRVQQKALKARDTRINDGEFVEWHTKVLAIENPIRRDLQLVSLFTGIRTDGIRNLRWDDVDFDDDLIHVVHAKGDKPYTVPMVATVRKIIEQRQRDNISAFEAFGGDAGFVFPSISRDGKRVQAVAEVKERRNVLDKKGEVVLDADGEPERVQHLPGIHANRRTFNSIAIEIGIPREPRERLMNHEGRGVNVRHYGAPQDWSYTRECADKIEAAIWERLRGKRPARARGKLHAV
ncbi:tyrosine-type recombinase/integrase [soil metagenome]